jgi:hypothetical protein
MNEKIRLLAKLADPGYTGNSEDGLGASLVGNDAIEKFAELIVRQCVKSTIALQNTAIDNEWHLDETFHMIVDTIVEDLDMQHIFRGEK